MSKDIEHTTAEELLAVVHSQLFTMSDATLCADALAVVVKIKFRMDKANRQFNPVEYDFYKELLT